MMALKGANDFQKNFIGMVDSILVVGRPNGLAVKRTTTRGTGPGARRRRDVRAIVFTDSVLDYLVHLHLLPVRRAVPTPTSCRSSTSSAKTTGSTSIPHRRV